MKLADIGKFSKKQQRPLAVDRKQYSSLLKETHPHDAAVKGLRRSAIGATFPFGASIRLAPGADPTFVLHKIRRMMRPRDGNDRMPKNTFLRPIGRPLMSGSQWFHVDFPVRLGSVLEFVSYQLERLTEFESELKAIKGVQLVELSLPTSNWVKPLQEFLPGCTAGRDAAVDDVAWAPRLIGYFQLPSPIPTGLGIRIGQVDSGYTHHPELSVESAYALELAASFPDSLDGLGGVDKMPGGTSHGTATGSIISSQVGTEFLNDVGVTTDGITGLAPDATIVVARVLDDVVQIDMLSQTAIAEGIWHCIDSGCHVITMSFGGFMSTIVKDAIRYAFDHDIILCGAAGNCVQFVVEPASMDEVVACAGVGVDVSGIPHLWPGSSHGAPVDVAAPAENVWIADWRNGETIIRPGEGTSFAAPHVAAAAALWLEALGRDALIEQYAGSSLRLGDVFKDAVKSSAMTPTWWDASEFGAGILNLPGLLNEALVNPEVNRQESEMDALDVLDLVPVVPDSTQCVIDFDRIVVRDDGEFWGGSEPYLLMNFFKIDGQSARLECTVDLSSGTDPVFRAKMLPVEGLDSFVTNISRGSHGDLDEVNIGPIELAWSGPAVIDIPSDIGRQDFEVTPIPLRLILETGTTSIGMDLVGIPGFIGVHAILSEQDWTSDGAVIAARDSVAMGITDLLTEVLSEITLNDLSVNPDSFIERQAEIEDAAKDAAQKAMNWWEAFWGGIVDPDDQLLQVFGFVNVAQIAEPVRLEKRYQGENGDFILVGEIRT
jgi:hypothetical protein